MLAELKLHVYGFERPSDPLRRPLLQPPWRSFISNLYDTKFRDRKSMPRPRILLVRISSSSLWCKIIGDESGTSFTLAPDDGIMT